MKIPWRISDDLGHKHQLAGTQETEGSWQLLKQLVNDPKVEARFGNCRFAHVFVHLSPADSEYSHDERKEAAAADER